VHINSPRGFHLGTSGLYVLCFNKINSPHYLPFVYHHAPDVYQLTVHYVIFICGWIISIFFIL
jgi:hypothetical protein